MMGYRCAICETPHAPFGFRMPGRLSGVTRKGYLWVCEREECLDAAEARRKAAVE